jgi:probable HAF family extracellular repeat protein
MTFETVVGNGTSVLRATWLTRALERAGSCGRIGLAGRKLALGSKLPGSNTRSSVLFWLVALTFFIALAVPIRLAAEEQRKENKSHSRYILKDLGALGGPSSFFFNEPIVGSVNNGGTVAGGADTLALDPFAPNCASPDCHILHAFQWRKDVITDLGTLPGGFNSAAYWINDQGLILGGSDNGLIDQLTGLPEQIAVLWKDGQIIVLGTLGRGFIFGNSMNSRSQVVGIAHNTIPDAFSFLGLGTETRAFLWQDGAIRDLGTLGGPDAWGAFINARGQIVGWSYTNSTPNPSTGIPTQHPFLWENGVMRDLGTLGGTLAVVGSFAGSGGGAINNRGQVIGTSYLAGDQTFHPFLWEQGKIRDLGTLGGVNAEAYWINDSGNVVGRADFSAASKNHHAFLWSNGIMTDLGTLGSNPCSTAVDINAQGQVIGDTGVCGVGGGPPFLFEDGGPMVDLNSLVRLPPSGMTLGDVAFINDRGEIAVKGKLPNGVRHDVLLIPCDSDHAGLRGCEDDTKTDDAVTRSSPVPDVQRPGADTRDRSESDSAVRWNSRFPPRSNGARRRN